MNNDILKVFLHFFYRLLLELSDFINSDDCIGKISLKSIRLYPFFIKIKIINEIEKWIISGEKDQKFRFFI